MVAFGFFCCSDVRELRNESILFLSNRSWSPAGAAVSSAPLAAPGLAAIDLEPVQGLKSEVLSKLQRAFAMNVLAACLKTRRLAWLVSYMTLAPSVLFVEAPTTALPASIRRSHTLLAFSSDGCDRP